MQNWNKRHTGYYRCEDPWEPEPPPKDQFRYWYQLGPIMLEIDWHSDRPTEYVASFFSLMQRCTVKLGVFETLALAQSNCRTASIADLKQATDMMGALSDKVE
jgi:hypothetical protein